MKLVLKQVLIWFLMLAPAILNAQEEPGKYPPDYDTNYIEDYRHRLNISLLTEVKRNIINGFTQEGKLLNYETNLPIPTYGIMFSYRWLNAAITTPIEGISVDPTNNGETNNWTLALGFTGRSWYLRNFFEYYRGYFLRNPESLPFPFDTLVDGDGIYPDMETITYTASAYYGFNGERYSHRALLWQSELQKKSAGTFLTGIVGGYKWISSDAIIFPNLDVAENITAIQYYHIGANAGYVHSFVIFKDFNFSIMLMPGCSYLLADYRSNEQSEKKFKNSWGLNAEFRTQVLYEIGDFYTGLSFTTYGSASWLNKESPVGSSHNYLRFNLGYRFKMKPIKFLKPIGLSY